jgi:hypothetical protein
MHTNTKKSLLEKEIELIKSHSINIHEKFKVNAPNNYENLNFDDFVLFSRVTKDIAQQLCYATKPSAYDIAQMLSKREQGGDPEINLRRLKLFSNNKDRLRKSLIRLLKSQYNLQENEVEPIMDELIKIGLLA